ncbi:thrombomodulin [Pelodytes ibericus]
MLLIFHTVLGVVLSAQMAFLAPTEQNSGDFICINKSCYVISRVSKKYQGASKVCKKQNGQLMTVRSSVEADAISTLMERAEYNISRLWIGLELPYDEECTDISQALRGFSWVTGDAKTDYNKWKTSDEKCGTRCVVVNRDQSWEETDCDTKTDGFLCEFTFTQTCGPIYLPDGYSVTYKTPFGMSDGSVTLLPPNTIATVLHVHLPLVCKESGNGEMKWVSETPGAWDCMIENGGCEFICDGPPGSPTCKCSSDVALKEDGRTCKRPCDPSPCDQQCIIISEQPGFACMCDEGYNLVNGTKCKDIDDCVVNPGICEHTCSNTVGSFMCSCYPGFELLDGRCQDVDECEAQFDVCEDDCINHIGGYTCICPSGYKIDEKNPKRCKRFCDTMTCDAVCDENTNQCNCPDGYILDYLSESDISVCTDIDECEVADCRHKCINEYGSYECVCPEGYILEEDTSCSYNGSLPETAPTKLPPPDTSTLQPAMLVGICIGILSMLTVIIAIICHMVRKRYMDQHVIDYKGNNPEKEMALQQVKTTSQKKLENL